MPSIFFSLVLIAYTPLLTNIYIMIAYPLMYQLIYTIGDRRDMDGGQLRWSALAAAIKSIANNAFALQKKFGKECNR